MPSSPCSCAGSGETRAASQRPGRRTKRVEQGSSWSVWRSSLAVGPRGRARTVPSSSLCLRWLGFEDEEDDDNDVELVRGPNARQKWHRGFPRTGQCAARFWTAPVPWRFSIRSGGAKAAEDCRSPRRYGEGAATSEVHNPNARQELNRLKRRQLCSAEDLL